MLVSIRSSLLPAALILSAFTGCGGSGGSSAPAQAEPPPDGNTPGLIFEHPASSATRSTHFIVDANHQGRADTMRIVDVLLGRLVDVFDQDAFGERHLVHEDFVVSPTLASNGQDVLLEQHPVTGETRLVILHAVDSDEFRSAFQDGGLLPRVDADLIRVIDFPFDASVLFSVAPRDATLVVQLDDLIDETTLSERTFELRSGVPPVVPFDGRLRLDPNHGDLARLPGEPAARFYSTRVLFDPTVSEVEALGAEQPLAVNAAGFPAGRLVDRANLLVRIPTRTAPLQGFTELLTNASGGPLAATGNGSIDATSLTRDVLRALRAGGAPSDPDRGYLPDHSAPRLVGSFSVTILDPPVPVDGEQARFLLPRVELGGPCPKAPRAGDVLAQGPVLAEVLPDPGGLNGDIVVDVPVRLIVYPPAWETADEWVDEALGAAVLRSAYDPALDGGLEPCFVNVFPMTAAPGAGVATSSTFGLRFNEAMAPEPFLDFDAWLLSRSAAVFPGTPSEDLVPGDFALTPSLREVAFVPLLPLTHAAGMAEAYTLTLLPGPLGAQDVAGNTLLAPLPPVEVRVDPAAAGQRTGGRVSRFTAIDADPPFGDATSPLPEWSGQHVYDLEARRLRPRPVIRYSALADRAQPMAALMMPGSPIGLPLTHYGCKLQTLWRYADLGLDVSNSADLNLDVEGLSWSPLDQVSVDLFEEFEVRLGHASAAPDEFLGPTGAPLLPGSGFGTSYAMNALGGGAFDRIVHERILGYDVQPGDEYPAAGGLRLMPFPWNQGVPVEEHTTFTWRDTALQLRSAVAAAVPPMQWFFASGLPMPGVPFYTASNAQSAGLPLMMEFRCYPADPAPGRNQFDTSLAVQTTGGPYFRAFTAGGVDTTGTPVLVDPDLESTANGAFDPTSLPFPGAPTPGNDARFYMGSVDFVVRVSRSVSVWLPAVDPAGGVFPDPAFSGVVVLPGDERQAAGTSLEVAFRGTGFVDSSEALTDAGTLDLYGDHYSREQHDASAANLGPGGIGFLTPAEELWRADAGEIDGASYYQMRLTFAANPVTGDVPEVAAVGLGWRD